MYNVNLQEEEMTRRIIDKTVLIPCFMHSHTVRERGRQTHSFFFRYSLFKNPAQGRMLHKHAFVQRNTKKRDRERERESESNEPRSVASIAYCINVTYALLHVCNNIYTASATKFFIPTKKRVG